MFQTEYLRNMNANYERILLDQKPEENRYQYCILNRGGIRGLLPCSLRYINGMAYLYYDISSRQNVAQMFGTRCVTREWMKDFLWSMQQIQRELNRFLLDSRHILWYPEQIFQDLESNVFSFLYFPYYEGDCGFMSLLDFLVEHIDYQDEGLADCVFHMYEQMEQNGDVYLQEKIFEDGKALQEKRQDISGDGGEITDAPPVYGKNRDRIQDVLQERERETKMTADGIREKIFKNAQEGWRKKPVGEARNHITEYMTPETEQEGAGESEKRQGTGGKRGLLGLLDQKRRRERETREHYRLDMQRALSGYGVAEDTEYADDAEYTEEGYGRTVYFAEKPEETEQIRGLYTPQGKSIASLEHPTVTVGKKKEEADVVLSDASVSRMHARIIREGKDYYLEDLNSTNGTYKNGLRLQPYEKRKLETGDELRCGRVELVFR